MDRCVVSAETLAGPDPNSRTECEAGRLLNDPAAAAMAGSESLLLDGNAALR